MKTFTLSLLVLAVAACDRTPPAEVTIVDNGTETCTKAKSCEGIKPVDRRDTR